jgi:menaquinol-cytochrome c reductase cytochrome b/c subunit
MVAAAGAILVLLFSAVFGLAESSAGSGSTVKTTAAPNVVSVKPPAGLSRAQKAMFLAGEVVVGQSGCEACHRLGADGNPGPGKPLTHIGSRLGLSALSYELRHPKAPMPSFDGLAQSSPKQFHDLVEFLSMLK